MTASLSVGASPSSTMTMLNVGAAPSNPPSAAVSLATVGIASGAAVIAVIGIAAVVTTMRRPSKTPITQVVYREEVPEMKNPIRVVAEQPVFERQRSMSYPPEYNPEPVVQRNPFAARGTSMKFPPLSPRTTMFVPPPPPPMD